jgi:hypothetical protein
MRHMHVQKAALVTAEILQYQHNVSVRNASCMHDHLN